MSTPVFDIAKASKSVAVEEPEDKEPEDKEPEDKEPKEEWERILDAYCFLLDLQ